MNDLDKKAIEEYRLAQDFARSLDQYNQVNMFEGFIDKLAIYDNENKIKISMNDSREIGYISQYIFARRILVSGYFFNFAGYLFDQLNNYVIKALHGNNKYIYHCNFEYILSNPFGKIDLRNLVSYISDIVNFNNITEISMQIANTLILKEISNIRVFDDNSNHKLSILQSEDFYKDLFNNLLNLLNYLGFTAHRCTQVMFPDVQVNINSLSQFPGVNITDDFNPYEY